MATAIITGSGLYTPKDIISNQALVNSLNQFVEQYQAKYQAEIAAGTMPALEPSDPDFIEKASGIKNRYVIDKKGILDPNRLCPQIAQRSPDEISVQAEMALHALEPALAEAQLKGSDIDAVICAASVMQRGYPSMSVEIQHHLGAKGSALDLQMACSSATFGLQVINSLIQSGAAKKIVMVNPEICSAHLDYSNRDSHFIFGDACTAMVIEAHENQSGFRILSTQCQTQYSNNIRNEFGFLNRIEAGRDPNHPPFFTQQGRKVFKEVSSLAAEHLAKHCQQHQLLPAQLKRFWLHQANATMNQLILKKLLETEPNAYQAPLVLDNYANTSSAGCVIAFHTHKTDFEAGEKGLLCSFGAGYSIGSALLEKC